MQHAHRLITGIAIALVCALTATALSLAVSRSSSVHATPEAPPLLRHIVLFDLKEGTPDDALAAIEAAAHQMTVDVETIHSLEWGPNLSFNTRNDGYDFVLLVNFASVEDLEIYGPHPGHDAFREVALPHVERVLVMDYWSHTP